MERIDMHRLQDLVRLHRLGVAGATTLNRSYRECARHYGFQVDPTPIRSPEKKGKVEAAVKYVKRNFFAARREELDAGVLGRELTRWTREIAGQRRHGTTQRRPLEVFTTLEQSALRALPTQPYVPTVWQEATVHPMRTSASGAPSTRCRGG